MPVGPAELQRQVVRMYARQDADPAALIASWPTFAQALHHQARTIDADVALRFERLHSSARAVGTWAATAGRPIVADPAALRIAEAVAEVRIPRGRDRAAQWLDKLAWATSGQLVSRFRDEIGNTLTSGLDSGRLHHTLTQLRHTMAHVQAVNTLTETDLSRPEGDLGIQPLAAWDVAAQRALTNSPSTLTLMLIADRQAENGHELVNAITAGFQRGEIHGLDAERILEGCDGATQAWLRLRQSLTELAAGERLVPSDVFVAATEAGHHLSGLDVAPTREVQQNVAAFLAGNVNLAADARSAISQGQLKAPAAAANRALLASGLDPVASGVDPRSLLRRETIALPQVLVDQVAGYSEQLANHAEWAARHAPAVTRHDPQAQAAVATARIGYPSSATESSETAGAAKPGRRSHTAETSIER